jgi:glucokinase
MMDSPWFLGVEIGGTKLQLGLGLGDGTLVARSRVPVYASARAAGILDQITFLLPSLLEGNGVSVDQIGAVGIGFGGPVDTHRGIVLTSHQIWGWDDFPLREWVQDRLGIGSAVVHNDADTAAFAEAHFGAGQGFNPLLYVTIGSGIGGGLVLEGRIYRGGGRGAVEIGHLWVPDPDDSRAIQRLEALASGWSIQQAARERLPQAQRGSSSPSPLHALCQGNPALLSTEQVALAARRGDSLARTVLDRASRAMAFGLAQATTLLAPQRIILGGGVSLIGPELWFEPIRRELDRLVFPLFRETYDLVPAELGEEVVLHGALALARWTWQGWPTECGDEANSAPSSPDTPRTEPPIS